jgi:hypothetical protein
MAHVSNYSVVTKKQEIEVVWWPGNCQVKHSNDIDHRAKNTLEFEKGDQELLERFLQALALQQHDRLIELITTRRREVVIYPISDGVMVSSRPEGSQGFREITTFIPHALVRELQTILQLARAALAENPDS